MPFIARSINKNNFRGNYNIVAFSLRRMRSYYGYTYLDTCSSFPNGHFKMVPVLLFVCVWSFVVSYVAFVLSLFVPRLLIRRCLWKDVLGGCGISWVYSIVA